MKKVFWLGFSGLIPLAVLLLALYIFDPFQLYHRPYLRKPLFNSNMYYQAAGIINNYAFDSVILGSSIMVNTSSQEASQKLGNHWVNLSMGGASIKMRLDVLTYALQKKKISNVIFSLEPGWLLKQDDAPNPYAYLYDKNPFNDFSTYLDEHFIACLFVHSICLKGEETLDRPSNWINEPSTKMRLGGFDSWLANANRPDIHPILQNILAFQKTDDSPIEQHINDSLIQLIKDYPKTHFIFIIPPFSRLSYKLRFVSIQQALTELLTLNLPNVKIYGFDDTSIPDDLSLYIDLSHYDAKVNSWMLDAIQHNTHSLTLENIQTYFQNMKQKVDQYDLTSLKNKILQNGVFKL